MQTPSVTAACQSKARTPRAITKYRYQLAEVTGLTAAETAEIMRCAVSVLCIYV